MDFLIDYLSEHGQKVAVEQFFAPVCDGMIAANAARKNFFCESDSGDDQRPDTPRANAEYYRPEIICNGFDQSDAAMEEWVRGVIDR